MRTVIPARTPNRDAAQFSEVPVRFAFSIA